MHSNTPLPFHGISCPWLVLIPLPAVPWPMCACPDPAHPSRPASVPLPPRSLLDFLLVSVFCFYLAPHSGTPHDLFEIKGTLSVPTSATRLGAHGGWCIRTCLICVSGFAASTPQCPARYQLLGVSTDISVVTLRMGLGYAQSQQILKVTRSW